MSDADSLISLLENKLPALEQAHARLKESGHAAAGWVGTARSSFATVLKGLRQSGRPENELTFLKQGIKYLRKADKSVDTLSSDSDGLLKDMLAWQKSWDARPLPNEREANGLLRESIRRIAKKEPLPECRAVKDGAIEELSEGFGVGWDYFDSNPGGSLLFDGGKGFVSLKSSEADAFEASVCGAQQGSQEVARHPRGRRQDQGLRGRWLQASGGPLHVRPPPGTPRRRPLCRGGLRDIERGDRRGAADRRRARRTSQFACRTLQPSAKARDSSTADTSTVGGAGVRRPGQSSSG